MLPKQQGLHSRQAAAPAAAAGPQQQTGTNLPCMSRPQPPRAPQRHPRGCSCRQHQQHQPLGLRPPGVSQTPHSQHRSPAPSTGCRRRCCPQLPSCCQTPGSAASRRRRQQQQRSRSCCRTAPACCAAWRQQPSALQSALPGALHPPPPRAAAACFGRRLAPVALWAWSSGAQGRAPHQQGCLLQHQHQACEPPPALLLLGGAALCR